MEKSLLEKSIQAAKEGDRKEKERIIKQFTPLLIKNIIKYFGKNQDFYDWLQEGRIVILESINNFNEDLGVPFPAYIKRQVFYYYVDQRKKRVEEVILDKPLNEEGFTLLDMLEDRGAGVEDSIINLEDNNDLYKGLKRLTKKQRQVIEEYYFKGITLKALAKEKKQSYQSMVKLKARALKRLRDMR